MNSWINAIKAPFQDQSTFSAEDKPTDGQVAIVWTGIGLLLSRVL